MTHDLDQITDRMLGPATRLVTAIHDADMTAAHTLLAPLSGTDLRNLALTLAALVPDDQALTTLLAWTRGSGPISPRQAAANRARLEQTLAEHAADRRGKRGRAA